MSDGQRLPTALNRLDLTRALGSGTQLLARFGAVGLLAFIVDVGLFNLARHTLHLGPLASKTISVIVATTVAFLGNRAWTFSRRGSRHGTTAAYLLFFALNGAALGLSLGCLFVSSYVLGLNSPLAENISSNVVGLGLGTLFRFWAYERWVFPPTGIQPGEPASERPSPRVARGTGAKDAA